MNLDAKINSTTVKLLVFLGVGLLSLLIQESLARSGLREAGEWFLAYPHLAFVNALIIFSFMSILISLFGRITPAGAISFLFLLLVSLVNYGKIIRLQQPLFAWDLLYFEQVFVLLPSLSIRSYIPRSAIEPLLAVIFVFFCVLIHREKPLKFRPRIGLFLLSSIFLTVFIYHREIPRDIPSLLATENEVWDQRSNYAKNGFLLAFLLNIQPLLINEPQEYCEAAVHELMEDIVSPAYQSKLQSSEQPISLVLFVSESFYDLLHLRYEAEEDPLENFHSLQSKFPSFRMISPTFGGNTSNVEFEMLTGISNAFFPVGAVPYDHYIKKDTPSLARTLKENGYRTIAIHPYHDWFWNRRNVYPKLGFDEFIALKEFSGSKQRGWFISDEALVDRIIDTIEKAGDPFFLYALSMQNHGEYDPHRYAPDEVQVKGDFPESLRLALQTYVTGVRDADRELARLLQYMESRPEPIVTLFCGDHLPSFGPDFALYREAGAIQSEPGNYTLDDHFKMASVPCLIWANKKDLLDASIIPEELSPIYFPPILLEQLGIKMPGHIRYLSQGIRHYPVIHRQFLWQSDGDLVDFLSEKDKHQFLKGLEMIQYDILFGERYSLPPKGKTGIWN